MFKYKQSTMLTCGPACLMMLMNNLNKNIIPSRKLELKILNHMIEIPIREAFEFGLVSFVSQKFKVTIYIESKKFYFEIKQLQSEGYGSEAKVFYGKINKKLIDKLIAKKPIAINLDCYVIDKQIHFPHWIVLYRENFQLKCIDPYFGKELFISMNRVSQGLHFMRNYLKMNPKIIFLSKK